MLVSQASFNLKFISPDSNQQLLLFVALSALIFLLFVVLTVILGRNLLKLYAERRMGVAGSKFRTRLVVVSLLLSFLPVIAMFWFSYGLMNRSIDKWFSQPVEEVRADTAAMASLISDYTSQNATAEAQGIALSPVVASAFANRISLSSERNFGAISPRYKVALCWRWWMERRRPAWVRRKTGPPCKAGSPCSRRCGENIRTFNGTGPITSWARLRPRTARLWSRCRCPRSLPTPRGRSRKASNAILNWHGSGNWFAVPTSGFCCC
jgi:hypothetical protein